MTCGKCDKDFENGEEAVYHHNGYFICTLCAYGGESEEE